MPTRREFILQEIERWRDEGLVDDPLAARLRDRYDPTHPLARGAELDAPAGAPGGGAEESPSERGAFAANAMQLVGGLLFGAALVALVFFLNLEGVAAASALLVFGAVGVGGALALAQSAWGRDREGLIEALLAAGLVPTAVAPFNVDDPRVFGVLAGALAVIAFVMRRGQGPAVILAGATFVIGSLAATIFDDFDTTSTLTWFAALLAFGALMLVWRRDPWTNGALGLYVAPLTGSFIAVLVASFDGDSVTTLQIVIGVFLGALLTLGLVLGARGLVVGAAAGLTVDVVVLAMDVGGPGTAVIVLLALGGLLVWQAETVRRYFRGRA